MWVWKIIDVEEGEGEAGEKARKSEAVNKCARKRMHVNTHVFKVSFSDTLKRSALI
jgi:hypothetical protein